MQGRGLVPGCSRHGGSFGRQALSSSAAAESKQLFVTSTEKELTYNVFELQ